MKMTVSVEINRPKIDVWNAITDIKNCPDMISGIISLQVLEQPESGLVGLKWTETREMFGKEAAETMWITDSQEQEYYYTRAENHGAIYVTKMSVEEHNNKTTLTMEFSGSSDSFWVNLLSKIMGVFIKKSMIKMLEQDLNDIKRFVENKHS